MTRACSCHHYIVACAYPLLAKIEGVDRLGPLFCSPCFYPLLVRAIEDSLCRADSSAHRPFPLASSVITQVALLHVMTGNVKLRHAKGAGITAVFAIDTARFVCRLYDAIMAYQNCLSRANLCARSQRILAVHAERRRRGHCVVAFNIIDVDHALAFMCIAFPASGYARAATDTARGIKKDSFYCL